HLRDTVCRSQPTRWNRSSNCRRVHVITADELQASIPDLEALPGPTLERIAAMVVRRRYAAGAVLYRAGDRADGLYFILDGRVRGLLRRIDELTATTITARVADYVRSRSEKSLGDEFILGISQEELARELGTAREVIVRALRALIAAGAIERAGRSRFRVRRLATLRAMGSR